MPASVPLEFLVLDAASGDPLRAQQIYEFVSQDWWEWFKVYRAQLGKHQKERLRKLER